jgi:cellobiose transport system permease protein
MSTSTQQPVSRSAARVNRIARDRARGRGRRKAVPWFTYLVLAAAVVLSVFPLYWMFVVGSNDSSAVAKFPPVLLPGGNFGGNVRQIFTLVPFGRSLLNSAIVAISVGLMQIFFCTLAGFAFAKMRFRGRRALFVFVIATMLIPTQLGIVPMYMIMAKLQWVDTLYPLIVPSAVSAFGVFWMRQVIVATVPDEVLDAARVDGCSTLRMYRSVVLPIVRGSAAVFGLFAGMTAWNDFLWPLIILNSPENFTVQVAIQQLRTQYTIDYSNTLAGAVLGTVPLLLLFAVAGKQLVAGIMEGAVKG